MLLCLKSDKNINSGKSSNHEYLVRLLYHFYPNKTVIELYLLGGSQHIPRGAINAIKLTITKDIVLIGMNAVIVGTA